MQFAKIMGYGKINFLKIEAHEIMPREACFFALNVDASRVNIYLSSFLVAFAKDVIARL